MKARGKIEKTMKNIFYQYSNVADFLNDVDNASVNPIFAFDETSQWAGAYREEFTGTKNYASASKMMKFGDNENAAKLQAATAAARVKADPGVNDVRPQMYTSPAGFLPCVPKYLNGRPDCMYNQQFVSFKNSKVITIVYANCVASDVDAGEINEVSAQLVSAILLLEKKGYRINLYTCSAFRERCEQAAALIKIKDSAQYIDKRKMAYPLVNPSMLRRHAFRFLETRKELTEKSFAGTHGCVPTDEDLMKLLKEENFKYDFFFSFYSIRNKSSEKIISMMNK